MTNQPKMSMGDLSRGAGLEPATPRRVAEGRLNLQGAAQGMAQRVTGVNIEKR